MAPRPYRVIQWGTGYTGTYALKYILMHPALELVGVKCHTAQKEGLLATDICAHGSSTVRTTRDKEAILSLDADCVIYMPRDALVDPTVPGSPSGAWLNELVEILSTGKNVVTSIASGTHYAHLHDGATFLDKLNRACERGRSTVLFTGFDPGFSDVLAYTMSGAVGAVTQIRTWEIVDYSTYPVPETLRAMGYGALPSELSTGALGVVRATWGGVPYLLAQGLGVPIDSLQIDSDFHLSPRTFTAPGGLEVRRGTIGALRFTVAGTVEGKPLLSVNHITRIGPDMAPEWPTVGRDGGYRVEIDGFPPFRADFPLGLPGGAGSTFADAMAMTAGRCVNCVGSVVEAAPGYKTFLDLMPIGTRLPTRRQSS